MDKLKINRGEELELRQQTQTRGWKEAVRGKTVDKLRTN